LTLGAVVWFFGAERFKTKGGNMGLNYKAGALALVILGAGSVEAKILSSQDKYLTTKTITVHEIRTDVFNQETKELVSEKSASLLNETGQVDQLDNVGKVISTARDLVALGEQIYNLVIKGKPSNTTSYAPISVIPKINGAPVDILDVEGFTMPSTRTYEIKYTNLFGMDTVVFRYTVMFSHHGSYDGKGAYITGAQIVPVTASTMFGYDFRASMKLGGLQNGGTKVNPVAAATLLLEYEVKTVLKADLSVDSFFITGKGGFKNL
jgi:hypothetical protein